MSTTGLIIAIIFFLLGIIGTFLPALPGSPLIWVGMLIYGLITEFQDLTLSFYLGEGAAVVITLLIDYAATAYSTKRYGGSRAAVWGSILGIFIGPFVLGPLGFILGPFFGALAMELLRGRPTEQSLQVALGTLIGLLGGTILKLLTEAIMIIWFFWIVIS